MYQYQWLVCKRKTRKSDAVAQIRQLNAKGKLSRRRSIHAIRVIMEFGITEKYAIALLDGKEVSV